MTTLFRKENRANLGLWLVFILATTVSLASFIYYFDHNLILAYGDSKAHLTLSRRVFSSLTPSFTQLGGIWLPLPHTLNLLTVWNDFMFYSGLSGSIISMASYVGAAILLYKSIYLYSKKAHNAFLGSLIMIFNPAFLYLQSTPMTESISIFFFMLSTYLIMKWAKSDSLPYLVMGAVATALSTLCRYDNWFLLPCAAAVIMLITLLKRKKRSIVEGSIVLYLTLAGFGIFLWVLYSQVIFGNALNFSLGAGSAAWYATAQHSMGKHNLLISIGTYLWTSIDAVGIISVFLTAISLIFFIIKQRAKPENIAALLFLTPIVFNTLSLFLGQSIIFSQHMEPFTLYNSRYGINALPAVAFFIGLFSVTKKSILTALLVIAMTIQYALLFNNPIAVLSEVKYGTTIVNKSATAWVLKNPTEGNTLLSDLSLGSLIGFDGRIPQEKIISEANGDYWRTSLVEPKKYASRVIMSKQFDGYDIVWMKLLNNPALNDNYTLVFNQDDVRIYDLNTSTSLQREQVSGSTTTEQSVVAEATACMYRVHAGDSLWRISKRELGLNGDITQLLELNKDAFAESMHIHPKQQIHIPCPRS